MDPFASHVIRALLVLLAPDCLTATEESASSQKSKSTAVRSKKSQAYKARQGPMKSVFVEGQEQKSDRRIVAVPTEFHAAARQFVTTLRAELNENEVRALAANQVASPVLQVRSVLRGKTSHAHHHKDASRNRVRLWDG